MKKKNILCFSETFMKNKDISPTDLYFYIMQPREFIKSHYAA